MPPQIAAGIACGWPLASAIAPPAAISRAMTSTTLRSMSGLLEHDDRAVSDDLAHGLADFGRVETHHDDRVAAHLLRILHHAVERMAARLFQQCGVFQYLAAEDGAQPGHQVARQATAAHDDAEYLPLHFQHPIACDVFGSSDQHDLPSVVVDGSTLAQMAADATAIAAGFHRRAAQTNTRLRDRWPNTVETRRRWRDSAWVSSHSSVCASSSTPPSCARSLRCRSTNSGSMPTPSPSATISATLRMLLTRNCGVTFGWFFLRQRTDGCSGSASSGAIHGALPALAFFHFPPRAANSATRIWPTCFPTRCAGGRLVARTAMSASWRLRF